MYAGHASFPHAGFLNQLVLAIAVAVLGYLYYESQQDVVRFKA